jgi:hypothetical protein
MIYQAGQSAGKLNNFSNLIKNMSKQATIWTVVIVVVLVILGLIFWGGNNNNEEVPVPAGNTGEVSGIVGENEVKIEDQEATSKTAVASYVFLQEPGYVVVHEVTASGGPGAVLGVSSLLAAGQSENVAIPLGEALASGKDYIAMLHYDNGDKTWNSATDLVATEGDGDEVLVKFEANAAGE